MHSDKDIKQMEEGGKGSIAHELAKKQKEISVAEFFEKNKHILGFDSRVKSLMMGVKEAVDNSLDACEEADIRPEIYVKVEKIERISDSEDVYRISIEDNGPGIVHKMIPNVFGRLLFGARFHALRQSRGQQGIGISATVMFGYITTGKPALVMSKIEGTDAVAWKMNIILDTKTNRPLVTNEEPFSWEGKVHGTRIEYYMKGKYVTGRQSIFEYIKNTAIVNPHSKITFDDPEGRRHVFERATESMPIKSKEIKPHPQGLEVGDLQKMAQNTQQKTLKAFLKNDFSRITDRIAEEILDVSKVPDKKVAALTWDDFSALVKAIDIVKIMAPQTDCLSPIGDTLIKKGLMHVLEGLRPDYYAQPVTRPPKAINGNPFIVEAGIVYGGEIQAESEVAILRFANRVPLLYQPGACVITKAIESMDWRRYGLEQRGGKGKPYGPAIILVHVASTKVPFTSEGKEAIANLGEIQNEIHLALRLCARNLKSHLNKKGRKEKTYAKFEIVQQILPQIAGKSAKMLDRPVPDLSRTISKIMNVVWVDPKSTYDAKKKIKSVAYTVYNYTKAERSFRIHAELPKEAVNETLLGRYFMDMNEEGKANWEVLGLPPFTSAKIEFDLIGDMADTFSESDVYLSGISTAFVMGADALPGDWGIKGMEITETELDMADEAEEEEEEDPDVDDDDNKRKGGKQDDE
ncbi:MAG: DNA topoisomerase VI subunit B [Methanomassiliicoccaceae archaeon]|jgi:DNA topoisomerase-6 subunit B|nr:DNA topoisomerase VI subunit B [Methanomassiliicoccaceae archaeon]